MERDAHFIESFLARVARVWTLGPDQRFGQFISNVSGHHRDPDGSEVAVADITDDDFSRTLDKSEADTLRRQKEFELGEREPVKPEIARAVRVNQQQYDRWAMRTFGRVGRDPARIGPFLHRFGEVWAEHPERRFGEMVLSAIPLSEHPEEPGRFVRAGLRLVEDDSYLELLSNPEALSNDDVYERYMYRGPLGDLLDKVEDGQRRRSPP